MFYREGYTAKHDRDEQSIVALGAFVVGVCRIAATKVLRCTFQGAPQQCREGKLSASMLHSSMTRNRNGGRMILTKLFSYGMAVALAGMLVFTVIGSGDVLFNQR